ncbi:hypothetical protein ACCT14_13485 [Rhizobium brockwellii]|uniref:hypothetical protein n=1 Tax=Rhizobium brockwellii TaxID=3019932 RepID=UPI003F966679
MSPVTSTSQSKRRDAVGPEVTVAPGNVEGNLNNVDAIYSVSLPGGVERVLRLSDFQNSSFSNFADDVFAASSTRRIGNTDWHIRMPFCSAEGVWQFDILYRGIPDDDEGHPLCSCLLCANDELAHDFWKVAMLVNLSQVPMPRTTPWLATMHHEGFYNLEPKVVKECESVTALVVWAILYRPVEPST